MKYLDKVVIAVALVLLCAAPSFATGRFAARQIRQGQRAQVRVAHRQNVQAVVVGHHAQQLQLVQPVYAAPVQQLVVPQQLNGGCNNGALQLNNGCSALYR